MDHTHSGSHPPDPPSPTADRVALRHLVDSYAQLVDAGDAAAAAALFAEDGQLVSRLHAGGDATPFVRRGRPEITGALTAGLERYEVTTHVVGGQVVDLDGDTATGTTVCLAHHVYATAGTRRLLVMAVRYTDGFTRQPGGWRFSERQLHLDWRQDRALEDRP
ncbi:MAG: nuclear transport factor 2 family protein [Acidimicrobiales bacterium]